MRTDTAPEWNGVPEIVASGTPYEIGLKHGSLVPARIAISIKNYQRFFLETAKTNWEESKNRAEAYLPSLKQNEPDLVEEMQGIADGAGVYFLDVLALNLRSEIALTNFTDGCTSVAKRDAGTSATYLAQNWDWMGEASEATCFFDIRKNGKPRLRMTGEAGLVGKFGFNDAGVGICMNAIRSSFDDKHCLPVHLAVRRVLECRSFDEAFDMLTTKGVASCINLMIADRSGKMATIECTPKGLAPIYPEPRTETVYHTNHLWSPNLPKGVRDFPAANSFSRLERMRELSMSTGGDANFTCIRMWLSDEKGAPESICRIRNPNPVGIERMETLATAIFDLQALQGEVSFGLPNLSPPVRTINMD